MSWTEHPKPNFNRILACILSFNNMTYKIELLLLNMDRRSRRQAKLVSIRSLADIITDRIVITCHEHISTVTHNTSAADPPCILPNNLRVVAADLTSLAGVCRVGIVLLFTSPCIHGISRSPCRATAPVYVLSKLEIVFRERMLHLAVGFSLASPPSRIIFKLGIPRQW